MSPLHSARQPGEWRWWLVLVLYNALAPLLFLALLPGWFGRARARGRWNERFGERLGRPARELREWCAGNRPVWVHAVSVGECGVALRLLGRWLGEDGDERFVVTTTTATGRGVIERGLADWPAGWRGRVRVSWAPFDLLPCAWLAVRSLAPRRLVLTEGEWWPNWLGCLGARGVRVDLYNARMSPRSARRGAKFRVLAGPILARLGWIGLQRAEDAAGFEAIGVAPRRLEVTGSVKLDREGATPVDPERVVAFRAMLERALGPEGEVVMGISTFAGEEELLARVVAELGEGGPGLRLVLVPRHAERAAAVQADLERLGWRVWRRSEVESWGDGRGDGRPAALLVDTTGELRGWLELAAIAVVGKSLGCAERGGQNPAEPIEAGAAVLCGACMDNFRALVEELRDAGGLHQLSVESAESPEMLEAELRRSLRGLLGDPGRRAAMVGRGRLCLARHDGATARTVAALRRLEVGQGAE